MSHELDVDLLHAKAASGLADLTVSMTSIGEGDLWNLLSAAGIIIMAPMFVLALAIRKYFVQGMTMGAVR